MSWRLITAPTETPVSVSQAKEHERISINDAAEDALIQNQLFAATRLAEEFTRRAFMPQVWEYRTSNIAPIMEIPRPPLIGIYPNSPDPMEPGYRSMLFTNLNDEDTVVAEDTWFIDNVDEPGRLIFKSNSSFPYPWATWGWGCIPAGYLTINFLAGYSDDNDVAIANIPWEIKEGILQIFGFLYQNREGQPIPCGSVAHTLLSPFKVEYL
jgi:hypothetical protein